MSINILIIKSEEQILDVLEYQFKSHGDKLYIKAFSNSLLDEISSSKYDFIIMGDLVVGSNSFNVCKAIREQSMIPIIIVTDEMSKMSIIRMLNLGVDDVIVNPVEFLEIKAKVRSILRRTNHQYLNKQEIDSSFGMISINIFKKIAIINNKNLEFTKMEFDIFYTLLSYPGKTFSRKEIMKIINDDHLNRDLRSIDVHIKRIRNKIKNVVNDGEVIITKWGEGYAFNPLKLSKH